MMPDAAKAAALAELRERCVTPHRRLDHPPTDAAAHQRLVDAVLSAMECAMPGLAELLVAAGAGLWVTADVVEAMLPGCSCYFELPLLAELAEVERTLRDSYTSAEARASNWLAGGAATVPGAH